MINKTFMKYTLLLLFIPIMSCSEHDTEDHHNSDYVGEESREIKSLSPKDIAALKEGSGWGLAKAAELNGYPGPIHVLETVSYTHLTLPTIYSV